MIPDHLNSAGGGDSSDIQELKRLGWAWGDIDNPGAKSETKEEDIIWKDVRNGVLATMCQSITRIYYYLPDPAEEGGKRVIGWRQIASSSIVSDLAADHYDNDIEEPQNPAWFTGKEPGTYPRELGS